MRLMRFLQFVAVGLGLSYYSAAGAFVIKQIQFRGLDHVEESTALSYVPAHVGQEYSSVLSAGIMQSLYNSGLFSDVRLSRSGDSLVITVEERRIIGLVRMVGNKTLPSKKLWQALRKMGITEGEPYDPKKLNEISIALKSQYNQLGRYDAKVDVQAVQQPRHRVELNITIDEGPVAKISTIEITGNKAFSQHRILKYFQLKTTGIFTWFTKTDRYSEQQFEKDLQHLQNFYFDHGYLDFKILSRDATVSPDHKRVKINIHISEGEQYHVSGSKVTGKYSNDPKIAEFVDLKAGDVFSRKHVIDINSNIANYFADKGYAFPFVNMEPTMNHNTHQVFLTFKLDPRNRIYVRHVNFEGNNRTKDSVLRSQMRQIEGGPYHLGDIKESTRLFRQQPYFSDIKATPIPVHGHPDQVDLTYHVKEVNAGRASVQGGYSDAYGLLYGASVSEPNFMGTGKYVSLGFQNSQYTHNYNISYNNPFYTTYGLNRGFNLFYTDTDGQAVNIGNFRMNTYGGNLKYGLPISEFDSLTYGVGFQHNAVFLTAPQGQNPPSFVDFLDHNPSPYNQLVLNGGYQHGTLDRVVLPTSGTRQSLNVEVGPNAWNSSLGYFRATFDSNNYFPLGHGFIFNPHAILGYGDGWGNTGALPFFNNYYAGGFATLPGFTPNTLGPRNPYPGQQGSALGGNTEIILQLNMIVPNFITDKLRTAVFIDAGNIFETNHVTSPAGVPQTFYENVSLGNLRVSTGLLIEWYLPVLNWPIGVSVAKVLNAKKAQGGFPGDSTQVINFSFGGAI